MPELDSCEACKQRKVKCGMSRRFSRLAYLDQQIICPQIDYSLLVGGVRAMIIPANTSNERNPD